MKRICFLLLLLQLYGSGYAQLKKGDSAGLILQKVYQKLSTLKNISYTYQRRLDYPSEQYHNEMVKTVFFDFTGVDTAVGFKYQAADSLLKDVYNGTEKFGLNQRSKTIAIENEPTVRSFNNVSFLYNSIITLKNAIPLLLTRSSRAPLSDTLLEKPYYLVTCVLKQSVIDNLGKELVPLTTQRNIVYRIIVDKERYLPVAIIQTNSVNKDRIETNFTGVRVNEPGPPELSWYYSTYLSDYQRVQESSPPPLLPPGSAAPAWALQRLTENKSITLQQLAGKVIVLEFWIKNCGHCLESVAALNELYKKWKRSDVVVIGINAYDRREELNRFLQSYKPAYPVLVAGNNIARAYGVSGYPTFFIINPQGSIVYAAAGYKETTKRAWTVFSKTWSPPKNND